MGVSIDQTAEEVRARQLLGVELLGVPHRTGVVDPPGITTIAKR